MERLKRQKISMTGSGNSAISKNYGMQAKLRLMRRFPDIGVFAVRAFYEKDPEDFRKLLEFWKRVYLRKNREEGQDDRENA